MQIFSYICKYLQNYHFVSGSRKDNQYGYNMERFRRTMALCLCTAAFLLGSCLTTTEELDLNKDISLDMQLGPGGLSIPLGSLDTLYLDSLIKVDGANSVIKTLEGGMYGFYMDGKIEPFSTDFCNSDLDKVTIPEKSSTATVSIDAIDLDEINNNFAIVPSNFSTPTVPVQTFEGISFSIPQVNVDTQTVSFGLNYDIPSALTRINKIWFGNDLGSRNAERYYPDRRIGAQCR